MMEYLKPPRLTPQWQMAADASHDRCPQLRHRPGHVLFHTAISSGQSLIAESW